MNSRLPMRKKSFIRKYASRYTVKELAEATALKESIVRYYLKTSKLKPWPAKLYRDEDYEDLRTHIISAKPRNSR